MMDKKFPIQKPSAWYALGLKISTAVIPATTVSRINRKGNEGIEEGNCAMTNADRALEARITEIEKCLNMFQAMVMREKVREEGLSRCIEN